MDAEQHRDGRIDARDLFEGNEIGERIEPQAIVGLRDHETQKAERAKLSDEGRLEIRVAIPGGAVWGDLSASEFARDSLDLALLLREGGKRPAHCGRRCRAITGGP